MRLFGCKKKKEQAPDKWTLQVFEDVCVDRAWDEDGVHVMLGKSAWNWLIFRNSEFARISPPAEGFPTSAEAITAGLAAIKAQS